jgi:hypothetical protein
LSKWLVVGCVGFCVCVFVVGLLFLFAGFP